MPSRPRLPTLLAALAAVGCVLVLAACADTLQSQTPGVRQTVEAVMERAYPVYWLGRSFADQTFSGQTRDPDGAYTIAYGVCTVGGQNTCLTALRVVTAPDNSFVPGGSRDRRQVRIRGRRALLANGGDVIEIPTGSVVVDIYANSPALAASAAENIFPLNFPGAPLLTLPAPTGNSFWEAVPPSGPLSTYVPTGPSGPTATLATTS